MMRTSLILLLGSLLLPVSAFAAESVTFTWAPLAGGQTVTEVETLDIQFGIDIFIGEANLGHMAAQNKESESHTSVLGKWTDKKKAATLTYGQNGASETQTTPDGKVEVSEEPSVTANKAYAVRWKAGGEPEVTYEAGGAVPDEERLAVLEDWSDLVRTEPGDFQGALVGQTLQVGGALAADGPALARLLSLDDDDLSVRDAKVTLQELRMVRGERCGVFAMELAIVGNDSEMNMTMSARGEAVIAVKGLRTHSVTLSGPVSLAATANEGGVQMNMTGGGDFAFGITTTYSK